MESPNYEISSLCSSPWLDGKDFLGHTVNAFGEDELFDFVDNSEISFPLITGEPDRKNENEGGKSLLRGTSTLHHEQIESHNHAQKENSRERRVPQSLNVRLTAVASENGNEQSSRSSRVEKNTAPFRTSAETVGLTTNKDDDKVGRKSLNTSPSPHQTELGCEENAAQRKANNIISSAGDSKSEMIKIHSSFSQNYIPKKLKEGNLFLKNNRYARQTVFDNLHMRANNNNEIQPNIRRMRRGKTYSSDFSLTNSTPKRGLIEETFKFNTPFWKADKSMTKPFQHKILNTPRNMERRLQSCHYSQTQDSKRDSKNSKTFKVDSKGGGLYLSNCLSCLEQQRNPRKTHRQVKREDRITLAYDKTSPGCISLPSINTSLTKGAHRKAAFHETLCKYSNTSSVEAIEALISRYTEQHQYLTELPKKGER